MVAFDHQRFTSRCFTSVIVSCYHPIMVIVVLIIITLNIAIIVIIITVIIITVHLLPYNLDGRFAGMVLFHTCMPSVRSPACLTFFLEFLFHFLISSIIF